MPLLAQTMTVDSVFSLMRARTITREDPPGDRGGVLAYLREELPAGVNSVPLAAYAFMSGYLNAISFTTSAIWCGFMTGNSVMLGLALARVSLGQRREAAFAINDAQATTALICFVVGIYLARLGDFSFWSGKKSADIPSNSETEKSSKASSPVGQDPELGLCPPPETQPGRSSVDWADSCAPTRVGTPVPQNSKTPRIVVPTGPNGGSSSSPTETLKIQPSPAPVAFAPARSRLWLITGTLIQALLCAGAGIACMYDTAQNQQAGFIARQGIFAAWTSPAGFTALGLLSLSMGFQGVMAHRMGSGFGATVVLSSLWVELVGSPGGIRWKEYRGVRVYTILLFIFGGLFGAVLRDAGVLGISNALYVGAGMRVCIALGWIFVKAPRRE